MHQSLRRSFPRRACACVVVLAVCVSPVAPVLEAADDPWFGRDKALHATVATGLGAGGYAAAAAIVTTSRTRTRVVSGLAISLGAGAAKEWWDRGRGTPSWRDFAWDGVGAAAGTTIAWLIDRARHRARTDRQVARPVARSEEPVGSARSVNRRDEPAGAGDAGRTLGAVLFTAPDANRVCPCP